MPIHFHKKYSTDAQVLVWHITESISDIDSLIKLDNDETVILNNIKAHHKKLEYALGQHSLRKLLELMNIPFSGTHKDENGKPHLNNSEAYISISHTPEFLAVAYHPTQKLGIDLEKERPQILKIAHRVFSESEILEINDDIYTATVMWSAKEALYKLYGKRKVDFRENLLVNIKEKIGQIKMPDHIESYEIIVENLSKEYLMVLAI